MQVTINLDMTPEEARAFFGMPDMRPLNELVVAEMTKRAKDQMDTLADPERFVAQWMSMSGKSMEAMQGMFASAMGAAPERKK